MQLNTRPTERSNVNHVDLLDRPCVLPGRRTHNVADACSFFLFFHYFIPHTERETRSVCLRQGDTLPAGFWFGFLFFFLVTSESFISFRAFVSWKVVFFFCLTFRFLAHILFDCGVFLQTRCGKKTFFMTIMMINYVKLVPKDVKDEKQHHNTRAWRRPLWHHLGNLTLNWLTLLQLNFFVAFMEKAPPKISSSDCSRLLDGLSVVINHVGQKKITTNCQSAGRRPRTSN